MSLVCTMCSNPVPEGRNQCLVCNRGFTPQLMCSGCRRVVDRGAAECPTCLPADRPYYGQLVRKGHHQDGALVARDVGHFGALSDVSVPDGVSDLLREIQTNVRSLLDLASRLSHYAQTEGTRSCIRGCRNLATELQEEFETRRGP